MKKTVFRLFLFYFVGCFFIENSFANPVLNPTAISNSTDISVNYLTQIFGAVGNVLSGGGSQMMGQLFLKLNWGIFAISSVVIVYAVIMGTVRLATEGTTVQQGKSSLLTLVKLAIGVSLVIPSASTGYSFLQDVVMKVVVEGVGLADTVWDNGLDYLDKGGFMWVAPVSNYGKTNWMMTPENVTALLGDDSMGAKIFQNEVCMLSNGTSDVKYNTEKSKINFPGIAGDDACGSVSWNIKDSCARYQFTPHPYGEYGYSTHQHLINKLQCSITKNGVENLVAALQPAAKRYYCAHTSAVSDEVCSGVYAFTGSKDVSGIKPYLLNAMISYYSAISDYSVDKQQKAAADQTKFIGSAEKEGWLTAGRYYWDMMRMISTSEDLTKISTYMGSVSEPSASKPVYASASDDFSSAKDKVPTTSEGAIEEGNSKLKDTHDNGAVLNSGAIAAVVVPTMLVPGLSATLGTAAAGLNNIGDLFANFTKDNHQNPIQFFYDVGNECIQVVINIWIVGAVLITANVMVASLCSASNPFGYGTTAMVNWIKPILMLITTMLWAAGFFLVYYVPLYPYMIFLFASIGWFISVIEAMVAAPLVALGLTHPENHDFLGKSEQAVMLLLGIFLQPVLLVIGLIAGIILSYVTFELLIYTFSGFIVDVMGAPQNAAGGNIMNATVNSPIFQNSAGGLLMDPLLLVLFCTIAYTVLTQSFSVTYLLRDNVMRWIGAPGSGLANPEQLAAETKSVASSMGNKSGQAMSEVSNGGAGAFETSQDQQEKMERRDKGGGDVGNPGGGGAGGGDASAVAGGA